MKKKNRPSEIITDLKSFKEINSLKHDEPFPKSNKKLHRKNKSIKDKYYLLDIYKNKSLSKQKYLINNLSFPERSFQKITDKSNKRLFVNKKGYGSSQISRNSKLQKSQKKISKYQRSKDILKNSSLHKNHETRKTVKDKPRNTHKSYHQRSLSYGEKLVFNKKRNSKKNNKSFFMGDIRRGLEKKIGLGYTKGGSTATKSESKKHNFLRKLRKIWKSNSKNKASGGPGGMTVSGHQLNFGNSRGILKNGSGSGKFGGLGLSGLSKGSRKAYGSIFAKGKGYPPGQFLSTKNTFSQHYYNQKFFGSFSRAYSPGSKKKTSPVLFDSDIRNYSKIMPRNASKKYMKVLNPKQILKKSKEHTIKTRKKTIDNKFISLSMMNASEKGSPSSKKKMIKNSQKIIKKELNHFVENLNDQLDEFVVILKSIQNDLKYNGKKCNKEKLLNDISLIFKMSHNFKNSPKIPPQVSNLCNQMIKELELTLHKFLTESKYTADPAEFFVNQKIKTEKKDFSAQSTFNEIYQDSVNTQQLVNILKLCARDMLKKGPKKNFDLCKVLKFIKEHEYDIIEEKLDPEKQKLFKIMIDLVQKQDVFDEVIKIIEEEGLDVESLFLASFEKLCQEAKEEEMENSSYSHSRNTEVRFSQSNVTSSGLLDSNVMMQLSDKSLSIQQSFNGDKYKAMKEMQGQLKLDLNAVKSNEEGKEIKGFHQEFMANIDQFSLSWRKQALAEMERGKQRLAEREKEKENKEK